MKYYVTADPHGYYTILKQALAESGFFADAKPHKLIILGDLFDRGAEACELQEYVLDLMEKDQITLIKSNHEDLFEELVTEDRGIAYSHHVSNGTFDTAIQLTEYDKTMAGLRNFDFADAAKRTPYYTKIIPAMLDYFETDHYIFVHGWIPCIRERRGYSYYTDWRNADSNEWKMPGGSTEWMRLNLAWRKRQSYAAIGIRLTVTRGMRRKVQSLDPTLISHLITDRESLL